MDEVEVRSQERDDVGCQCCAAKSLKAAQLEGDRQTLDCGNVDGRGLEGTAGRRDRHSMAHACTPSIHNDRLSGRYSVV